MERKPHFKKDGIRHATIKGHRLHLRLTDPAKENFLWINGQQPPLIVDQTAAEFIGHLIDAMWKFQQGEGDESERVVDYVVEKMYAKHGGIKRMKRPVTKKHIKADLDRIFGTIMAIAEGACPLEMNLKPKEINYADWNGPARMDLALTYRCNLKCQKCYLTKKKIGELALAEWLRIYEILWGIGVANVVFTGGEPGLRKDLVELVSEADEFVTGLITNGILLSGLAEDLAAASLDYVQITIESLDASIHDNMVGLAGAHAKTVFGINAALKAGLSVVTNTTLTKKNSNQFLETIEWLSNIGVKNVACNTLICSGNGTTCKVTNGMSDADLKEVLIKTLEKAEKIGVNLQWYSPTCYNQGINPLELGLGIKSCSAAAHNMTIQPDGTVLPCQSWPDTVGNILTDDWKKIWNNDVCLKLRTKQIKPYECVGCDYEYVCCGGCPLDKTIRQPSKKGGES